MQPTKGKGDFDVRTKLQIGAELAVQASRAGFVFRAVAADAVYGDQDDPSGGGHRGSHHAAGQGHLVPGHQLMDCLVARASALDLQALTNAVGAGQGLSPYLSL